MLFAGLPSAMAAKLVKPDVAVMAIVGDGGFLMNSQVGGSPQSISTRVSIARHAAVAVCLEACLQRALGLMPCHGITQECLLTCHSRCRACSARHLKLPRQSTMQASWTFDRLIRHHITLIACGVRGNARIQGPFPESDVSLKRYQSLEGGLLQTLHSENFPDAGILHCRSWRPL